MTRLRRRGMCMTNDGAIWRILELSRLSRDDELAQLLAFCLSPLKYPKFFLGIDICKLEHNKLL